MFYTKNGSKSAQPSDLKRNTNLKRKLWNFAPHDSVPKWAAFQNELHKCANIMRFGTCLKKKRLQPASQTGKDVMPVFAWETHALHVMPRNAHYITKGPLGTCNAWCFSQQKRALRVFRSNRPVATICLREACAKTHDFAHGASIVQDSGRFETRPHSEHF